MKKCPFCAESIQDEAIKCRYCQSFLEGGGKAASSSESSDESSDNASDKSSDESSKAARAAEAADAAEPAAVQPPRSSSTNEDGWEGAEGKPKNKAKPSTKSPIPMLLKPEVAGGSSESNDTNDDNDAPEESVRKRKVLYSGSPSWRAFFKEYAIVIAGALIGPFITLWVAGLFDAGTFSKFLAIVIPLFIAGVAFLAINIYRKSKIFRVTTTNIESEYGLLSKKIDVLELWRCRDVRYQQSLMDRILRIAHIEVMTADISTPHLCIEGLPASRQLFEKIRDSIEIQRQSRNVVGFVQ